LRLIGKKKKRDQDAVEEIIPSSWEKNVLAKIGEG